MGRVVSQIIVIWGLGFTGHYAAAYPTPVDFSGKLLRWHITAANPQVTYAVAADDEAYITEFGPLVDLAAAKWSDVNTSLLRLSPTGPDEIPQITLTFKSQIDGGGVAAGYSWFDAMDPVTGPEHCSIEVLVWSGMGEWDLSKTILHELGHCLGLGHSLVAESIMSYDLGENTFDLDIDDRAALTLLYPADGSQPKMPPGCAVHVARPTIPRVLGLLLLLPLLFPLVFPVMRRHH